MGTFRIVGVPFAPGGQPDFDKAYVSSLSFVGSGSTLVDENNEPITFGVIVVPYDNPPDCSDLFEGETRFWYDPLTHTVYTLTKEIGGACVLNSMTPPLDGVMFKSQYDPDDTGIVTYAAILTDGVHTKNAFQVADHIDNHTIHAVLNDAATSPTTLWSSEHTYNTILEIAYGGLAWSLYNAADADIAYPVEGHLLVYLNGAWSNVALTTAGGLSAVLVEETRELRLEAPDASNVVLEKVAAVDLSGHRAVMHNEAGEVIYASADNLGHMDGFVGVTTAAAMAGYPVHYVTHGEIVRENMWSWTPGLPIYLQSAGQLAQTPPASGFVQQVGLALSPTSMLVSPRVAVELA